MSIGTILIIIVILALVGMIPVWPHSRSWGYGPSGGVGLIVVILVILLLLGKIQAARVMLLLVGGSRVYLGAHYLSSMLNVAVADLAWLALSLTAVDTLRRNQFV